MSGESEAFMPTAMVQRVLEAASSDLVLVGGQALAFWMDHYGIHPPADVMPAVSRDVDFFTRDPANVSPLAAFARAIGGRAEPQRMESITALVGSAVAPANDGLVYNVDLIHQVLGIERAHVEANAVPVPLPGLDAPLRILHPLDVLQSRNVNLHRLREKQDDAGQLQLRLAIAVARAYFEEQVDALEADASLSAHDRERAILDLVGAVDEYSVEGAARKNAQRFDIHVADAIPAWRIQSPVFWSKQWQFLRARMSGAHAAECERRAPPR